MKQPISIVILLFALLLLNSACQPRGEVGDDLNVSESAQAEPTITETPLLPTATETILPTSEATPIPFVMTRNIPYISEQLKDQKLDLYIPNPEDDKMPVIFAVHGGGGDKGDFLQFARYFAEQGYATVSINYRQMPAHTYPAPMKDTFCALAWIYANADEYHFDTTKIVAVGHSLGGTFVAGVGTMEERASFTDNCPNSLPAGNVVQAVITFTGVFDYSASAGSLLHYYTDFFEASPEENSELWENASPITWVDAEDPPFLLVHGDADNNIPPEQSVDFATALDNAGVKKQLLLISGGTHFSIINSEEAYQAITDFLKAAFE